MTFLSTNLIVDNCFDYLGKFLGTNNTIRNIFNRKLIKKEKEVFNISKNMYTYNESKKLCKAFNATLATYNQVNQAYKNGAEWCNYGWSDGQMGLYPSQKKSKNCNKEGVNGGNFDKNLKFGANCYGYKPDPEKARIVYLLEEDLQNNSQIKKIEIQNKPIILQKILPKINKDELLINKYKNEIKKKNILILPFNKSIWSRFSSKKSKYLLFQNQN